MPASENKALLTRYYDDLNAGRLLDTLADYLAPDVIARSAAPEKRRGLANWHRILARALEAMPGQQLVLTHLVAEGDLVVAHGRRIARWHPADFRGVPLEQSDTPIDTAFVHICRVEGGKILEMWSLRDELDMAAQLGARLAPGASVSGDGPVVGHASAHDQPSSEDMEGET